MESRSQKLGRPRRKPEEIDDVAEFRPLSDQPGREGSARGGGDRGSAVGAEARGPGERRARPVGPRVPRIQGGDLCGNQPVS